MCTLTFFFQCQPCKNWLKGLGLAALKKGLALTIYSVTKEKDLDFYLLQNLLGTSVTSLRRAATSDGELVDV